MQNKQEKIIQMIVECPCCKKEAIVYKYQKKRKKDGTRKKGLYIQCDHCVTRIFSKKGVYLYLHNLYPIRATLKNMSYLEWNDFRREKGLI